MRAGVIIQRPRIFRYVFQGYPGGGKVARNVGHHVGKILVGGYAKYDKLILPDYSVYCISSIVNKAEYTYTPTECAGFGANCSGAVCGEAINDQKIDKNYLVYRRWLVFGLIA